MAKISHLFDMLDEMGTLGGTKKTSYSQIICLIRSFSAHIGH